MEWLENAEKGENDKGTEVEMQLTCEEQVLAESRSQEQKISKTLDLLQCTLNERSSKCNKGNCRKAVMK